MKKNTSRTLICSWKWDLKHCSLWPVNSRQSSRGHIKGLLFLISRDDVPHGKAMGSRGSTILVPQQQPGCWVCGAMAACPGEEGNSHGLQARRHSPTAPMCPRELHPTPLTGNTGQLQNCMTETGRLVSKCQAGCWEPRVHFLLLVLYPSVRSWLRWVPKRFRHALQACKSCDLLHEKSFTGSNRVIPRVRNSTG